MESSSRRLLLLLLVVVVLLLVVLLLRITLLLLLVVLVLEPFRGVGEAEPEARNTLLRSAQMGLAFSFGLTLPCLVVRVVVVVVVVEDLPVGLRRRV